MTVDEVLEQLLSNPLTDITLSGGEPFMQAKQVKVLARRLREAGRNIWAYTGYTVEQLLESGQEDKLQLLQEIDVLVDGPFSLEHKVAGLMYRGSSNQRVWKMEDGKPNGLIYS